MLVVRVELWPYGEERDKSHLGTAVIANDSTGWAKRGNYNVWLGDKHQEDPWDFILDTDSGIRKLRESDLRVEGFPRLLLDHWHLLGRALAKLEED